MEEVFECESHTTQHQQQQKMHTLKWKNVCQYMKTVSRLQAEKGVYQWKEGCSCENWISRALKNTSLWQSGGWIDREYQMGS